MVSRVLLYKSECWSIWMDYEMNVLVVDYDYDLTNRPIQYKNLPPE